MVPNARCLWYSPKKLQKHNVKFVNREMQRIKGTYEHIMKKSKKHSFTLLVRCLMETGQKTEARTNGSQKPKAKKQSHKKPRVNENQNTTKSEKMQLLHSVHTIEKGVSGSTVSSSTVINLLEIIWRVHWSLTRLFMLPNCAWNIWQCLAVDYVYSI